MSWFVFTDDELDAIAADDNHEFVADLKRRGEVTSDDTLLVQPTGKQATILVAAFNKYPRRLARDPPTNTKPWPEAFDPDTVQG